MASATHQDPFQKMLMWSGAVHVLLFASLALGGYLMPSGPTLPVSSNIAFINVGASGPTPGMGGSPTPPEPEPAPAPPEPEPEPEPEPKVVRPSKETRDLVPEPDAPVAKEPRWERVENTNLTGDDAATGESAKLRTSASGLDLGGTGGGSPFDQDFEYSYYVQQMLGRIQQHWQRTAVQGTAVVVIQFTILKNGSVQDAQVEESTGVPLLDRGALRAVMLADPMPPLPNSYPRDRVGVHLRFTYTDNY